MWTMEIERAELVHLGVRNLAGRVQSKVPKAPKEGKCLLLWLEDELTLLPDIVVLPNDSREEFFAWTTTYVPHLSPLSALVRVVEFSMLGAVTPLEARGRQSDKSVGMSNLTQGLLGILHAEVAAAFQGLSAPINVGMTPYLSTLSWAAFQAMRHPREAVALNALREAWEETRRMVDARRLGYDSRDVEDTWALVLAPTHRRDGGNSGILEFLESVTAGVPALGALGVSADSINAVATLGEGPMEHRVDVFRKLVDAWYSKPGAPVNHAITIGFALSQISQGSFKHTGMVGPDRVPDARPLLWYGWFEFCRDRPEPASGTVANASQRLLKLIREWEFGCARRDISIDELRVRTRLKDPFAECLVDTRHPLSIEMFTNVVVLVQPGRVTGAGSGKGTQTSLFGEH